MAMTSLALPIGADPEIGGEFSLMGWHGALSVGTDHADEIIEFAELEVEAKAKPEQVE